MGEDAAGVARAAAACLTTNQLDDAVVGCRACPRLVAWRETVAQVKRKSYADELYWGRPVPSWGPADASIAIVGLAPAAHGGNRTGPHLHRRPQRRLAVRRPVSRRTRGHTDVGVGR